MRTAEQREYDRLRYLSKSVEIKDRVKKWRQENREKYLAYNKAWNKSHPEVTRNVQNNWRAKNREHVNAQNVAKYKADPDKYKKKKNEWFSKHPEVALQHKRDRRARLELVGGSFTTTEFDDLKGIFGNICLSCHKSGSEVSLHADHVVPISLGGTNDISNIQPLCRSCNSSKSTKILDYRSLTAA